MIQGIPSTTIVRVVHWSVCDVFRAEPAIFVRGSVLLLAAVICQLGGARTARAAGCHVADRPLLALTPTWERELAINLGSAPPVLAPPVLTHPPCQGEVPRLLEPAGTAAAASWEELVAIDRPARSPLIPAGPPCAYCQPLTLRLDRPPRVTVACVRFVLPV